MSENLWVIGLIYKVKGAKYKHIRYLHVYNFFFKLDIVDSNK